MANAAIFNALMRPVRSVDDYLTQYENRDAQKAQIQQNALAAMQNQQLREAQIGEIRTRQQQAIAEQQAKQQQEAARRAALLRAGPVTGIQANAASGMTGPTPQAAAAIGQRRQINASELLAAGVPIEQIRLLAEADTLGMPEVARVLDTIGADRMPVQRREDKFGRPIGDPLAKPVKMELEDFGGTKQAINPYALQPGQSFTKTQSPDSVASVNAQYANANATRDAARLQADATRAAANAQRDQATEIKLAGDYRQQSKDFAESKAAHAQLSATLKQATKSPAATLAAATKFMKILDPGSVVRESELGMALAASGVIDRAMNYINILQRGKVLTEVQAKDFENISNRMFEAAKTVQQSIDKDYTAKAKTYGLRPEMVVQDLGQNGKSVNWGDLP